MWLHNLSCKCFGDTCDKTPWKIVPQIYFSWDPLGQSFSVPFLILKYQNKQLKSIIVLNIIYILIMCSNVRFTHRKLSRQCPGTRFVVNMGPWHWYWWNSKIFLGLPFCHKTETTKRQLPKRHHGAFVTVANRQGNRIWYRKKYWYQYQKKIGTVTHCLLICASPSPFSSVLFVLKQRFIVILYLQLCPLPSRIRRFLLCLSKLNVFGSTMKDFDFPQMQSAAFLY